MGNTANYVFPYPDKTSPKTAPADMKTLADAIDAHLLQRLRGPGPSISSPLYKKILEQAGVKTPALLAETIPWELALLSCNAKGTPAGTQATNQRLALQAVYLEKGQIIDGMQKYCLSAYTSFVHMTLSLWTYNGTTFTCVATTSDLNTGTGFRGITTGFGYTVPASGVYYVGFLFNGTAGTGTDLQFVDGGGLMIAGGDFTGGKNNIGMLNAWPRVAAVGGITNTTVGQTVLQSATGPVSNQPWVAVLGQMV
jgi:hypothetical protein